MRGSPKRLSIAFCVLVHVACSSGTRETTRADEADDALVIPEGLRVTALAGGNGVLELIAITLREGPSNLEAYVSLRNDGETPACSAAVSLELFDADEQSLAAGISGLLTQSFYRLSDGSGSIAACVGPGEVSMVAVTDLPSDIAIEDVGSVVYRCPYFALDVVPIAGLTIGPLEPVTRGAGTAYAGTLVNGLDSTVRSPSVTVFPITRAGRPLGVAMSMAAAAIELAPGERWDFQTNPVDTAGVDHVAYPAGAIGD